MRLRSSLLVTAAVAAALGCAAVLGVKDIDYATGSDAAPDSDADADADAGSKAGCAALEAGTFTLCSDFDESEDVVQPLAPASAGLAWKLAPVNFDGLSIDPDGGASPPNALRVALPEGGPPSPQGFVHVPLMLSSTGQARVRLDLRVDDAPAIEIHLVSFAFSQAAFNLVLGSGRELIIAQQVPPGTTTRRFATHVKAHAGYSHVTFSIDTSPSMPVITVDVDGTSDHTPIIDGGTPSGSYQLQVGLVFSGPNPATVFEIDNVVLYDYLIR
jgi:hypothetical protein